MFFSHSKSNVAFLVTFDTAFSFELCKILLILGGNAPHYRGFPQRSATSDQLFSLYFEPKRSPEVATTAYFFVLLLYKLAKLLKITT